MTTHMTGAITDVACPRCQGGIVRWAEHGYVPGWRICDLCEAHYLGDPATGRLALRQRGRRVTDARRRSVAAARAAAAEAETRADRRMGSEAGRRDLAGSYHGRAWHAWLDRLYAPSTEWHAAYTEAWRAGATAEARAVLDELGEALPAAGIAVLRAIRRDGGAVVIGDVVLYRSCGTGEVPTSGLRAALASGARWPHAAALASAARETLPDEHGVGRA
jgi:hypothetical protein